MELLKASSKRKVTGIVFVLPALVCIVILTVYPVYEVVRMSFSEISLGNFGGGKFVGLENFVRVFQDKVFIRALKNLLLWLVIYVPMHYVLGFLAALALNRPFRFSNLVRLIIFLPWTFSLVSATLGWMWFLHTDYGLLNALLRNIGLEGFIRKWLSDPSIALYSLMVVNTWYQYPFVMLGLLAALQTVPEDLIAAARVDGANRLQTFFHVVLPSIKVSAGLILILSLIYAMQAFTTIWVLTGGGPANATELPATLIYKNAFTYLNWSKASAMSVLLFVFSSFAIIPYVRLATREAEV